jgi:ParB family transcriptional regulator, chromosome partitioning protein
MDPLGRGLESLIPDKQPEEIPADLDSEINPLIPREEESVGAVSGGPQKGVSGSNGARSYEDHFMPRRGESIFWIELEKIEPNPLQPRREFNEAALAELASSIREHGVLQPILVTKRDIETPTGLDVKYELIAGERRFRAARLAGLSQIPSVIRRGMPDDRVRLELALIENVQREDLNPIEKARAFKQLIDEFHMVQREIAARVGKSREMVANTLRLITLPPLIQDALAQGRLTEGHARAVLMAGDDQAKQTEIFNSIIEERLTVREAENKARQISGKTFIPRKRPSATHDPLTKEWQNRLQERLGTRVVLQRLGDRGRIVVEFFSDEELKGILDKIIREA